jgi:hypothetical protein
MIAIFIAVAVGFAILFTIGMVLEYKYHMVNTAKQSLGLENFESGSGDVDRPPSGTDDQSRLSPGGAASLSTEKLLSDFVPVQTPPAAGAAWSTIPSQTCLASDQEEALKPSRSYYQRTNNYKRTHPDDCSAPFHEMLGTFYAPTLGVGATAPTGLPLPGGLVECNGPAPTPKGWGGVGSLDY